MKYYVSIDEQIKYWDSICPNCWYKKNNCHCNNLKWLEVNRTHEECCDCKLEYSNPPKCNGHVSGPTPCKDFIKNKENKY